MGWPPCTVAGGHGTRGHVCLVCGFYGESRLEQLVTSQAYPRITFTQCSGPEAESSGESRTWDGSFPFSTCARGCATRAWYCVAAEASDALALVCRVCGLSARHRAAAQHAHRSACKAGQGSRADCADRNRMLLPGAYRLCLGLWPATPEEVSLAHGEKWERAGPKYRGSTSCNRGYHIWGGVLWYDNAALYVREV